MVGVCASTVVATIASAHAPATTFRTTDALMSAPRGGGWRGSPLVLGQAKEARKPSRQGVRRGNADVTERGQQGGRDATCAGHRTSTGAGARVRSRHGHDCVTWGGNQQ